MPDGPHFHKVAGAATQDERAEHNEDPVEGQVRALAHEVEDRQGYAVIRECDQKIGDDVQPEDPRVPVVTEAVGHEIGRE